MRQRVLQVLLVVVGLLFVALVYPLTTNLWHASNAEVEAMFFSIYATLGVFVLLAVRKPAEHRSLIAFTAWSSLAHAAVMAIQAVQHATDRRDLVTAAGLFTVIGISLVALAPARQEKSRASIAGAA